MKKKNIKFYQTINGCAKARQKFHTSEVTHFTTKRKLETPDTDASSSCQAKLKLRSRSYSSSHLWLDASIRFFEQVLRCAMRFHRDSAHVFTRTEYCANAEHLHFPQQHFISFDLSVTSVFPFEVVEQSHWVLTRHWLSENTIPPETNSNDFGFLNYLADSNSIFVVAEMIFLNDSNFWCVQSSITHNVAVHVHVLWPVCTHTIPFRMLWCL